MRKTLYLAISLIVIIGLTGCGEKANTSSKTQTDNSAQVDTNSKSSSNVDLQKAKEIALSDAGFKESDVTDLSFKKDDDEDKYDVEFKNGGKEYDYDISLSGDILNKTVENDD